jgi:endonuclease/exonuclease/phosphatase family metal-dependent hydrolase
MVSGGTLRLGSFNLFSGRSLDDGLVDAGRLAEAVAATGADVLAVQEVDRAQPRSGGGNQAAEAAAALGAEHWRYVETVTGTPGVHGWRPAGPGPQGVEPGYGVALISRRPVAAWRVLRMPPGPGRFPIAVPSRPPQVIWLKDEPRVVVAAVLEEPRITVACAHLSFVPFVNAWQLRRACRWLAGLPGPRVLLGDLNLTPGLVRRVSRWTPLVSRPTFPAPGPRLQLDHALGHGLPDGTLTRGDVRRLPISDHLAVLLDLELPSRSR